MGETAEGIIVTADGFRGKCFVTTCSLIPDAVLPSFVISLLLLSLDSDSHCYRKSTGKKLPHAERGEACLIFLDYCLGQHFVFFKSNQVIFPEPTLIKWWGKNAVLVITRVFFPFRITCYLGGFLIWKWEKDERGGGGGLLTFYIKQIETL